MFNQDQLTRLLDKITELLRLQSINTGLSMGINGHRFVTDNSYINDTFSVLVAWGGAAATCDYTVRKHDGTTINYSDVIIQDGGIPIYGVITNLEVTDGTVCAYYALDYK